MSFLQRAQTANPSTQIADESSNKSLLDQLWIRVKSLVSMDQIAVLAQSNEAQARSEITSACRDIFSTPSWGHVKPVQRENLVQLLLDSIFGLGILENLLKDDSITEIMVNGTKSIFIERNGTLSKIDKTFDSEEELRTIIDRILGPLGRRVDESSPMVHARLLEGHRVNVVMPPISLIGPVLTIRKFSSSVMTLDSLVKASSINKTVAQFLTWAVCSRKSIAVSGGTGSGKTTFLNALSCEIPHTERLVTIEDSAELRFLSHPHVVSLEARPQNAEGLGEITIRQLVTNALRMRPDRIVVGECRSGEALDMLQAMNTGHDGSLTTLHANSPAEAISRLATMVRFSTDLPLQAIESDIASAICLIVQLKRDVAGRRFVSEIDEPYFDSEKNRCVTKVLWHRPFFEEQGSWISYPVWVDQIANFSIENAEEVSQWKRICF